MLLPPLSKAAGSDEEGAFGAAVLLASDPLSCWALSARFWAEVAAAKVRFVEALLCLEAVPAKSRPAALALPATALDVTLLNIVYWSLSINKKYPTLR